MKTAYYTEKIKPLSKDDFNMVVYWLDEAENDDDVSFSDLDLLNNLADDIYYQRINKSTK